MAKPEGIVGDATVTVAPPKTEVDQESKDEERAMARFSKTKEYKKLKEFLEARIKYYQNFLPGSEIPLSDTNIQEKDLPMYWKISTTIVKEFQGVLDAYEGAAEAVENADK